MSFKTQKEIWEFLLAGGKLSVDGPGKYLYFNEYGRLATGTGSEAHYSFTTPHEWSLYEEPKKMKTVTLYRYTYQLGLHFYRTGWSSEAFIANQATRLVKTETETIEIEDV